MGGRARSILLVVGNLSSRVLQVPTLSNFGRFKLGFTRRSDFRIDTPYKHVLMLKEYHMRYN
jgi:hypothetical protein